MTNIRATIEVVAESKEMEGLGDIKKDSHLLTPEQMFNLISRPSGTEQDPTQVPEMPLKLQQSQINKAELMI